MKANVKLAQKSGLAITIELRLRVGTRTDSMPLTTM